MPSVNQNDERTSGKCWGDRIRLKAKSTERRNPKMQEVKRERESTPFSLIKGKSSGINSHFCIWWLNLNIQNINLISGRGSRAILVSLALLWFCRFHNSYMWGTPRTVSCLPPDQLQPFPQGLCLPELRERLWALLDSAQPRGVSRPVWRSGLCTLYFSCFTKQNLTDKNDSASQQILSPGDSYAHIFQA